MNLKHRIALLEAHEDDLRRSVHPSRFWRPMEPVSDDAYALRITETLSSPDTPEETKAAILAIFEEVRARVESRCY